MNQVMCTPVFRLLLLGLLAYATFLLCAAVVLVLSRTG
jgi:hypothetical protein